MMRARTVGLLLFLATLLLFLPSTLNQFINFDDPVYVVGNPYVNQGLSWAGLKWAFASSHASNWHPLTWLSHMLDCDLFHLNPAGHHLVSTLIHAFNTVLLFALILRLTNPLPSANEPGCEPQNVWPAVLAAALFAWHPLHVESVAWVSERKDVLSTFFSLLSLFCYARYVRKPQSVPGAIPGLIAPGWDRDYGLALMCFGLALLSKAMPVTLPVVMCLLDYWPLRRGADARDRVVVAGRLALEKLPFFAVSGIICVITMHTQHHAESSLANIPLALRLENVVTAYVGYLGKLIWPLRLSVLYPYPATISHLLAGECALLLSAISWLVWRERLARPYLLVGWLWFLVSLLPVIGVIQVGSQSMADRYSYFPSIGLFLSVGFALQSLARRFSRWTKPLVATCAVVLVACVFLTERQLGYWHDSETLFRHALAVEDSEMARICLGVDFQDKNELDEAMNQFLIASRFHPDSVTVDFNLGLILSAQGKLELAAAYFEMAARQHPRDAYFYESYGRLLVTLKRYAEAEKALARAIQIDPQAAEPHFLRARLLLKVGRDQEAVADLEEAMRLDPQDLEPLVFTATVLATCDDAGVRDGARAKKLARQAVEATRNQDAVALDVLAMSAAELEAFAEASIYEQKAIQVATAANQQEGLETLQKHLDSFQHHQSWRESFKTN